MKNRLFTFFISTLIAITQLNAERKFFNHPGLLHSRSDLDRISQLVEQNSYPAMGSYELLRKNTKSSYNYSIKGPYTDIGRDGKYGYTKGPCENDCNAAYYNALMWCITHDKRHADKCMEIIRGYARKLKGIHGHDAPLCAGLQGFMLINAAEIVRYTYADTQYKNGWNSNDTEETERMFKETFLPILTKFINARPYANGNWGGSVNKMLMSIGIFCNDTALYNAAIDYYYNSKDNGSLPNYIAESGQIQESGRDQAHCMLGVGVLAETAECAWQQGDDLYSALDNRIMKGYEYLSKVNLGYTDVPFETWKDATGKYCNWHNIGEAGLGQFRSVFEIAYNHYVERKGLKMPYTEKVLQRIRPEWEGWTCDNPGFGTLLFYLGEEVPQPQKGQIYEIVENRWKGWTINTPTIKPIDDKLLLVDNGISMQKSNIEYDASKYPYIEVVFDKRPKKLKEGWLRISYSVNSAPEFWTFNEKEATKAGKNRYIFRVTEKRSNNGTPFGKGKKRISLYLDFGDIDYIGVKSIISTENINQ